MTLVKKVLYSSVYVLIMPGKRNTQSAQWTPYITTTRKLTPPLGLGGLHSVNRPPSLDARHCLPWSSFRLSQAQMLNNLLAMQDSTWV